MEALQPPSAAAPAPGAQMAPERRGGAQERYEPQRRTCRWDPLRGVRVTEENSGQGSIALLAAGPCGDEEVAA